VSENKLNRLERSILAAEESAEDARWLQAEEVVRRLDRSETVREVAASWTNGRTGKPYAHGHVQKFATIWREFVSVPIQDRPPFSKLYDDSGKRTERYQQQAPESEDGARKLGANLAAQRPEILSAVLDGYNEATEEAEPRRKRAPHRSSLNDEWQAWLNQANTVLLKGARLAERTEDEEPSLDGYAEAARLIYQRMTERKLDAEIRELFEEAGQR
jgi:hypothetical protein